MSLSASELRRQMLALEPAIAAAFLAWVRQTVGAARLAEIERLVARGSAEAIAAALGITGAALAGVLESIRTAYLRGGQIEVASLPARRGQRTLIQFDVRNTRAEAWLREHSSRFVTRVTADQIEAIRAIVTQGAMAGANPRRTALDIVGRIGATGRRVGGVVGLTAQQASFVANARAQLLSGDPVQMAGYFERQLRDRRFDGIVRRPMQAGRPVAAADVDRITARYADRLLMLRGETIARTETLAAFNTARDEAMQQAIEAGQIDAQNVVKVWRSASDGRVRESHVALNGQKAPFDTPFRSPTGALMRFPGDTSLGAGAQDVANCRCIVQNRVDYLRQELG